MGKNVSDATRREIDGELSFALYGAANRMIRMHKPFLEPMGLTFPQYLVMVELLDGTPRTVGDLGGKLGMDTGTITPLLKRLEKAELVTRRRDANDERRVLIDLTAAGDALRGRLQEVPDQIKSACRLTDDMAAGLRDTLAGIARPESG
jgi:MarR family transcriptional regulator, organic hydroperoxide resistance regulator